MADGQGVDPEVGPMIEVDEETAIVTTTIVTTTTIVKTEIAAGIDSKSIAVNVAKVAAVTDAETANRPARNLGPYLLVTDVPGLDRPETAIADVAKTQDVAVTVMRTTTKMAGVHDADEEIAEAARVAKTTRMVTQRVSKKTAKRIKRTTEVMGQLKSSKMAKMATKKNMEALAVTTMTEAWTTGRTMTAVIIKAEIIVQKLVLATMALPQSNSQQLRRTRQLAILPRRKSSNLLKLPQPNNNLCKSLGRLKQEVLQQTTKNEEKLDTRGFGRY